MNHMHLQMYLPSLRKFVIAFLLLTIIVPGSFVSLPKKAEAKGPVPVVVITDIMGVPEWVVQTIKQIGMLVEDITQTAKLTYLAFKEAVLDPIAKLLGTQLTEMLKKQMFSFIATGNNGAPAFVTNPQNYFGSVAEESTQVFLTDLQFNRPDMLPSIRNAVRQRIIEEEYVDSKQAVKSTFPGGDVAYQAYLKNPSTCPTGRAWDCYLSAHEAQNDPTQIYMNEHDTLVRKRESDVNLSQDEILAGSGYHTLKECIEKDLNQNCLEYSAKTAGDTLARQVNEYLSIPLKNLENADEVDEVITAGMGALQGWMTDAKLINLKN